MSKRVDIETASKYYSDINRIANISQDKIEALKKNEFGQYIVDDLNKMQRAKVWRHTEHPCSAEDPYACLDCPYTDCIAPATITNNGASHIPEHIYNPDTGEAITRHDGSWMPKIRLSPKGSAKRRQRNWFDGL